MDIRDVVSHDGIALRCAEINPGNEEQVIVLVLPFGLKAEMARPFFDFFKFHYRVITWESRSILEDSDRPGGENEFVLETHVRDFRAVFDACKLRKASLVGYCSGAGVALAIENHYPHLFENLILVHGEYAMFEDESCSTTFSRGIDALLSMAAAGEKQLGAVFKKMSEERFSEMNSAPSGVELPFTQLRYFRRLVQNYVRYKSVEFEELAKAVTHKTLVLCGSLDVHTNVAGARKIKDLVADSQIHVNYDADHYGLLRSQSSTLITIWNYLLDMKAAC